MKESKIRIIFYLFILTYGLPLLVQLNIFSRFKITIDFSFKLKEEIPIYFTNLSACQNLLKLLEQPNKFVK